MTNNPPKGSLENLSDSLKRTLLSIATSTEAEEWACSSVTRGMAKYALRGLEFRGLIETKKSEKKMAGFKRGTFDHFIKARLTDAGKVYVKTNF